MPSLVSSLRLSALLLASALLAPGAQAQIATQLPVRGGILPFALAAEPPTYDCHQANTFAVLQRVSPHYSTLLKFEDGKYPNIIGDAAVSWTVSPDEKTFTFKLHPNITFHDGTPFTSEDVKATYERIRTPPQGINSVRAASLAKIARIDTPDKVTVVFQLSDLDASIMNTFASPWNCLYSAAKLKENPAFPARNIYGTGPFKFVEHVAGSHWVGTRNENYFKPGQPYLDGFRAITMGAAATVNAMEGKQILAEFRGLAPNERDRLVRGLGNQAKVMEMSWNLHMDIVFNMKKKPFEDVRVRRALSLAIDRWTAASAMGRISVLREVGGVMRPGSEYARTDEELEQLPGFGRDMAKNRAEARRLLKEAGAENLTLVMSNRNIPPYVALGVFIIDQWRQVGVKAENLGLETAAWTNAINSGNFDILMDSYTDHADDPSTGLTKFLAYATHPVSSARFEDPELYRLHEEQGRTLYSAPRKKLVYEFERRAMEQAYTVPILWWFRIIVMNSRVNGWTISPSHMIYQDLASVWLTPQ